MKRKTLHNSSFNVELKFEEKQKKDGKQRRFTNPIEAIGLFAFRILIER